MKRVIFVLAIVFLLAGCGSYFPIKGFVADKDIRFVTINVNTGSGSIPITTEHHYVTISTEKKTIEVDVSQKLWESIPLNQVCTLESKLEFHCP
jgi:hypothetical protein